MGAYDAWGRKSPVVIPDSVVEGVDPLYDYPMLITADTLRDDQGNPHEMFDADGAFPARADGGDFRLTYDEAGTLPIPVDIVSFSINNDPELGACEIHAKIPTLYALSNTPVWAWYHKPDQAKPLNTDSDGRDAVWADYATVVHARSLSPVDSTGSAATVHVQGGSIVPGPFGDGVGLDNNPGVTSSNWVDVDTKGTIVNLEGFLLQVAARLDSAVAEQMIACCYDRTVALGSGSKHYIQSGFGSLNLRFVINNNENYIANKNSSAGTGYTWITGRYSNSDLWLYENGEQVASDANSSFFLDATNSIIVGKSGKWSSQAADLALYELRMRLSDPGPNWIATEFANQSDPIAFATAGAPQTVGSAAHDLAGSAIDAPADALAAPASQLHAPAATPAESPSDLTTAPATQAHALAGSPADAASDASTGATGSAADLAGEPVEAAADAATGAAGQDHAAAGDPAEAGSDTNSAATGQAHSLTGQAADAAGDAATGEAAQAGVLTGSPAEGQGDATSGAAGQHHGLAGDAAEAGSDASTGSTAGSASTAGDPAESGSDASQGGITHIHAPVAADAEGQASMESGAASQVHGTAGVGLDGHGDIPAGGLLLDGIGVVFRPELLDVTTRTYLIDPHNPRRPR